jgi:hypothetical protein
VSKKTKNKELVSALKDTMFAKTRTEFKNKLEYARECANEQADIGIYKRFV